MKSWQFFTVLLLSIACVAVSVATVVVNRSNRELQTDIQARRAKLNSGVFSQQGQQITSNILQAMANESASDASIRQLLLKHGYNVQAPPSAAPLQAPAERPAVPTEPVPTEPAPVEGAEESDQP